MTRRVGLVARADDGGLGTMTREFHRHLRPEATLVVDLGGQGRGAVHPEWYPGSFEDDPLEQRETVRWTEGWPTDADVLWLLDRCDVVYSAEVLYHHRFLDLASGGLDPDREDLNGRRVPVFLHAMPELWDVDVSRAETLLPTSWLMDRPRFADACHLPVPVALDRFEDILETRLARAHAPNPGPPRLLHVAGPAMLDRNGTALVAAALRHVRTDCVLTIVGAAAGQRAGAPGRVGNVEVRFVDSAAPDYWSNYEGHDLLVQPRRYGGLSLVHQEAAAAGLGLVMLDRAPDREFPGVHVPTLPDPPVERMKGGTFPVEACDPVELAALIDHACQYRAVLGDDALEWADELAWSVWRPRYEKLLRGR